MPQSNKPVDKLATAFKSFDFLGETVSFQIDGQARHKSYLGALLSIAITVITLSYAATRFQVMQQYGDTTHQLVRTPNDFSIDNPLTQEQSDFNLVLGVQTSDVFQPQRIDYHGYVEISLQLFSWNITDSTTEREFVDVNLRPCSQSDVEERWQDIDETGKAFVLSLQCLDDPTDLAFYGDLISFQAQTLQIELNRCVNQTYCKSEAEIDEWLRNKVLQLGYVQRTYDPDLYGEEPFKQNYKNEYIRLQEHVQPETITKKIVQQDIESEENFFNPGWFSPKSFTFFQMESNDQTFVTSREKTIIAVQIFLDRNVTYNTRSIYNVLDFLGDVGGLLDALELIAGSIIGFIGRGRLSRLIISSLFFVSNNFSPLSSPDEGIELRTQQAYHECKTRRKVSELSSFDWLRKYCNPKARKRDKMFQHGEKRIAQQLDVAKFLEKQLLLDVLLQVQFSSLGLYFARRNYSKFVLDDQNDDRVDGLKVDQEIDLQSYSEMDKKQLNALLDGVFRPSVTTQPVRVDSRYDTISTIPVKVKRQNGAKRIATNSSQLDLTDLRTENSNLGSVSIQDI